MRVWLNKWTTSKRQGSTYPAFLANARQAKQLYFREMKRQKRIHWDAFLEDLDNIWKAHSYTKPTRGFIPVPTLHHEGKLYHSDSEKEKLLLQSFFPSQPMATAPNATQPYNSQLPWNAPTKLRDKICILLPKAR